MMDIRKETSNDIDCFPVSGIVCWCFNRQSMFDK